MSVLLDRVKELIASTEWDEAKQKMWLVEQGEISWEDCTDATLRAAIKRLKIFDNMFPSLYVDKSIGDTDNALTEADVEGLRVYRDDG